MLAASKTLGGVSVWASAEVRRRKQRDPSDHPGQQARRALGSNRPASQSVSKTSSAPMTNARANKPRAKLLLGFFDLPAWGQTRGPVGAVQHAVRAQHIHCLYPVPIRIKPRRKIRPGGIHQFRPGHTCGGILRRQLTEPVQYVGGDPCGSL